ncbi:MAG TPA: nitronate monooxygenase [bacterium]|nr:nitronate monooxygenase [bacterium]
MNNLPIIIQAGMGAYISTPHLAKISSHNPLVLGTVSAVLIERIMVDILGLGDPGGHYRRAFAHFPFPEVSERIISKYFIKNGILKKGRKAIPVMSLNPCRELIELMIVASFAIVWLAKEEHERPISVNCLGKMEGSLIFYLLGAIMAGANYITIGAGIPLQIPNVLDAIVSGTTVNYRVQVKGSKDGFVTISFDPMEFFGKALPLFKRPYFLPIVSSYELAALMVKKLPLGSIEAFIIEKYTAGGHSAPPRTKGESVYGSKDEVDYNKLSELNIPFYIAGSGISLKEAWALGAVGIQAGTIFALSDDSGMKPSYRNKIRYFGYRNELIVRTDFKASPTGYPFKVVELPGTLSDPAVYNARKRVCNICGLRTAYEHNGKIYYSCPGEPINSYLGKGGKIEDTVDVMCLCNALLSAAGYGNPGEPSVFTLGNNVDFLPKLMRNETDSYSAIDTIKYLLS